MIPVKDPLLETVYHVFFVFP